MFTLGVKMIGQLDIENTLNSNTPKQIEMKNIIIDVITCGAGHSLLLTNDGVIYVFGELMSDKSPNRNT